VSDSIFARNATDGYGAAVFNDRTSELVLARVAMTGNRAGLSGRIPNAGYGGAIYNYAASGTQGILRIFDSQITGNQAVNSGGGILNQGAILNLTNASITDNLPNNCVNSAGTGCP
jgi:hypothetical protein